MSLAKQMKTVIFSFGVVAMILVVGGCTPKKTQDSPEAVLQSYVTSAINAKTGADKTRLYEYTTGPARERLEKMSEDDFVKNLVKPQYKFVHFSTHDLRDEGNGSANLVYEIVFENSAGDTNAKITNRKIAYLKKENNLWRIEDTRNVKSFVEMKEGMNIQFP